LTTRRRGIALAFGTNLKIAAIGRMRGLTLMSSDQEFSRVA